MRHKLQFNLYHFVGFIYLTKLVLFAVDHQPCFFMGDSASYLLTAMNGWAPADRSYTYGLLIGFLTAQINSLQWVVFCQMLLSAGSASLVCIMLNRVLGVSLSAAAICGIVCTFEPLQLLSERFVLTEAPSTFFFAVLVTFSLLYLKRPKLWLLLVISLTGVYLISLRVSFLPAVLLTSLIPILASGNRFDKRSIWRITSHVVAFALLTAFCLYRYEIWYGAAAEAPPSLNGNAGFFLISDVAPILQASDFPDPSFGQRVLSATQLDIHRLDLRTGQHFASSGLCQTLLRSVSPTFTMPVLAKANAIARAAAIHAIWHHPRAFANLVGLNIQDYFKTNELQPTIEWDEFRDQALDGNYQKLIAHFNDNVTRQPHPGPVMNWHFRAGVWYVFLIVFPLIPSIYLLIPGLRHKRELLLLTLYAWVQWATCTVFIEHDTPRFETALAWLFFPIAGILWVETLTKYNLPLRLELRSRLRQTAAPELMRYMLRWNIYQVIGFIVLVKLALFAADHTPYFFMGDSASYLLTAFNQQAPWDRSYTYGLFLRLLMLPMRSLTWVIFVQTVLSTGAACLTVLTLNRVLSVRLWIAALCGLLCAVEPLQLLSERYILTEAPSTFLFAVLTMFALLYLQRPRTWLVPAIPLVGVYLVSLRISYLAPVLAAICLPLLSFRRTKANLRLLLFHCAAFVLLIAFGLYRYEVWYGEAAGGPPSLNEAQGFFLLASTAPIVHAADFEDPSFGQRVLDATKLDLHKLSFRTAQHFAHDGLCETILRTVNPVLSMPAYVEANRIARGAALRALRNHPREFAELVRKNISEYFQIRLFTLNLLTDEFRDEALNPGQQKLISWFNMKVARQPPARLVMNWHLQAKLWYMFLVVFPLIPSIYLLHLLTGARKTGTASIPAPDRRRELLLLTFYAWSQWAVCTIFIEHATPRFETGLAWLFFTIVGVIAEESFEDSTCLGAKSQKVTQL